jgi:hypothetical protein
MSSKQSVELSKPKLSKLQRLQRISGRKKDLLIIVSGVILGASTQYLSTHAWYILNDIFSLLRNWIFRDYSNVEYCKKALCTYIQASTPGMWIKLAILVIVILFMVFFFRDTKEDEIITILKQIRERSCQ